MGLAFQKVCELWEVTVSSVFSGGSGGVGNAGGDAIMGVVPLLCSFVVADSVEFGSSVINQFVLRFYHFSLGIYPYRGFKLFEVGQRFLKTQLLKKNEFLAYQSYLNYWLKVNN
jgi:hypothetical protein